MAVAENLAEMAEFNQLFSYTGFYVVNDIFQSQREKLGIKTNTYSNIHVSERIPSLVLNSGHKP